MWVLLNDSFLSIVAHNDQPGVMLVRARRRADIKAVFPQVKIIANGGADYEFRAEVDRRDVEAALVGEVRRIDYGNFKDSVRDRFRHDLYLRIWSTLMQLAPRRRQRRLAVEPDYEWPR
jgi:hypothetical protein